MFLIPPIGMTKRQGVAGPSISFVGIEEGEATGGSALIINKPAGVAENDTLIALVVTQDTTGPSWTGPAGWTEHYDNSDNTIGDPGLAFYTKVAGTSEPSDYSWTSTEGMRDRQGMVVAYRGASVTFDVSPSLDLTTTSGSTSHTIAGITTAVDDTLYVLCVYHASSGSSTQTEPTIPTGTTKRLWSENSLRDRHAMGIYDEARPTLGATGTKAMTTSSSCLMGVFRLALKLA